MKIRLNNRTTLAPCSPPNAGSPKSFLILLTAIFMLLANLTSLAQTPGCADLSFDGNDDYVSVATSPAFSSTFTIEAWIKSTSTGGEKNIVSWGSQTANNHNVQFRMDATKLSFGIWDGSTWNMLASTASINTGNWVHVAVVKSGTSVTLYVNGVADISGTVTGSATVDKFMIGRFIQQGTPVTNSYFPGNIQDIRIWTTARTATEINMYKAVLLNGTETGLLINYKMREGSGTTLTNSVTGNAYPATINNGASWNAPVALEFNGSNNYISFASNPAYTATYTLEAWIKSTSSANEREIASWGNTGASHNVQFRMSSGKLEFGIYDGSNWTSTASSTSINTGNWTHVAVVKSGTTVILYINGVADGTGTNSLVPTVNQFEIGNWIATGNQQNSYFPGNIRDVRVWNVARTATEINNNKAAILAGTETGLVRYYKINEGTGSAIANSVSGAAYPGTINGTANWNPAAPVLSQVTVAQTQCNFLPLTPLSVSVSGITSLSYQWYSNATASNTGGTLINGATLSAYTPPSSVVGTSYYYCTVTNGACYAASSAVSGAITVTECVLSITSSSPANGPVGTLVTINGAYLSDPTTFTIGGVAAVVVSNTGTQLVALVMPGAASGGISVVSPLGTATAAFTVQPTPYPSLQQGTKLVGTNYVGQPYQGISVAVSADGNTAIVGGAYDNNQQGAVWIFTRSGSTWSQQGLKLVGTGAATGSAARQGMSVAISADGNTAIVGGIADNNSQGAVWVYTRSGNNWTQQGLKLVGTGGTAANQGRSVALSADGNTAIVGGDNDNSGYGAVWVFTRTANNWSQQGSKLVANDNTGSAGLGASVSLSADGNTAIVGGKADNTNIGATWVFIRSAGTWSQQGPKLVGTGYVPGYVLQGNSVSLSADGNTAIIGGYTDNYNQGAAWVFIRSGSTWTQQGSKIVGTGNVGIANQGGAVAISADGNTALVSGYNDNSFKGATWVYTRSAGTWSQQGNKMLGTGIIGADIRQGQSVSLSADGKTAMVGGPYDNTNIGAAWVFVTAPPTITSFTPSSAATGQTVTITGTNFTGATAVSFGGTAATSFTVVSATSITALVAAGTTGTISVTTPSGSCTSSGTFTYISPAVQVFTGGSLQASYTTIKTAFDAINAGTHTGDITVKITAGHTLTASAVLNASGTNSASYTALNIYPVNTGITISGLIPSAPLIDLNGADNVTIDGRVNASGSVPDLILSNTWYSGTAGTSTIRFVNDATSNTVKYCTLKGSYSALFSGGTLFFSTGLALGNSNNSIDHNNITWSNALMRPSGSVYSVGTSAMVSNANNTISNNNFYDFLSGSGNSYGINISTFSTAWTISGNSFYETTSLVPTYDCFQTIIGIDNTTGNNFSISNNYIGGSAPACGGSPFTKTNAKNNIFKAISIITGPGTASNIQGNTITNFSYANSGNAGWTGISIGNCAASVNVGTTTGNTIGAATGTDAIVFTGGASNSWIYGIYYYNTGASGNIDIQNNSFGAITAANSNSDYAASFLGIYLSKNGNATVSNNMIGSLSTANSIKASSPALAYAQYITGIHLDAGYGSVTSGNTIANITNGTSNANVGTLGYITGIFVKSGSITNNTVRDLTIANANNSQTQTPSVRGIVISGISPLSVSGNTVYNLSNTYPSFSGEVTGIYYDNSVLSTVSGNYVHDLSVNSASTGAKINGIKIENGPATFSNNIISLGGNTSSILYGIYHANTFGGSATLYFNTIYLSGSPATGALNSYALYSWRNYPRDFKDNVFYNARSNSGSASGTHYAMSMVMSGGTISCDYNNYFAPGVGGKLGSYSGTDKTSLPIVPGQDAHSITVDPLFASAGGTLATDYKPGAILPGISISGFATDFAGTTRAATPTMGVYESVTATPPTLGPFTAEAKTYGDADFALTAPTSNSSGAFTYGSSNPDVATIAGNTVTITGAGTSTITATQAATANYSAGTATAMFTVGKADQILTLSPLPTGGVALNTFTTLDVSASSSAYGLQPVISLGTGSAATLNNNSGNYSLSSIGGTGTVTIEVNEAGNTNYNAATTLVQSFDVTKGNQTITFDALSPLAYTTGLSSTLTATTSASGLSVSFAIISGPATVSGNTLSITGAGTVEVEASQAGNESWNPATSLTRSLLVTAATPSITSFAPATAYQNQTVTITGTNFADITGVSFGGTAAGNFTRVNATTITAIPDGGATGNVAITSLGGNDTKAGFTYLDCVPEATTEYITACGSYTWHGVLYTESNYTATWTGVTAGGCESIVTLSLTITICPNSWTGAISTDWYTAGNWSGNAVPLSTDDVMIADVANNPLIGNTGVALCSGMTINSGAVLTLAAGSKLTVAGALTNLAGTSGLVIQSDADGTGSLLQGSAGVAATIQRYVTGSTGLTANTYHLVSVPLAPEAPSTSNLFLGAYLYDFDVATNRWNGLGNSTSNDLDETKGYMIYAPESAHTYTFEGPMNAGTFSPLATSDGFGNNLVPNPYPSAIDWDASGWTKDGIANSVYMWPSGGSNYATYVDGVEDNGGSNIIAAGQAFIVKASGAPVFTMTDAVRVHSGQAFNKSTHSMADLLRIKATYNEKADEAVIRFTTAATSNADADYDAWKLYGSDGAPQLYTLAADNEMLAINSLPYESAAYTVPLNFEQKATGEVSFAFSNTESFDPAISIHMQDLKTGTTVNLREQNTYTFSHSESNDAKRFKIIFGGTIGIGESQAETNRIWISDNILYINTPDFTGKNALVNFYNMTGQIVMQKNIALSGLSTISLDTLKSGAVVAKLAVNGSIFTTKGILIRK